MKNFNRNTYTKRNAFTMIELIMAIIVLGILAAVAIPRLDRDHKQHAADSILSNIRYTQHLAVMDYKHKFDNPNWQKRFWKIMFAACDNDDLFYRIGSDDDMDSAGTFDKDESAIDPISGLPIYLANNDLNCDDDLTVSSEIFLSKRFGVTAIDTTGCNDVAHIGFDHLGRPHQSFGGSTKPDYGSYLNARCTFTFTMTNADTFSIHIEPETGHAFIDTQVGS